MSPVYLHKKLRIYYRVAKSQKLLNHWTVHRCLEYLLVSNFSEIITHTDESRGIIAFIRVCLCVCVSVCPHDRTKTTETTITKLATGTIQYITGTVQYIRSSGFLLLLMACQREQDERRLVFEREQRDAARMEREQLANGCSGASRTRQDFLSVAVSTTDRQVSRLVAFFRADERPIFSGLKSASIACSQVWLGLPFGRFQSEGSFWIANATEWRWSSFGELRMMWPKRRNLLSVLATHLILGKKNQRSRSRCKKGHKVQKHFGRLSGRREFALYRVPTF